jgi:hypothetical protein
LTQLLNGPVEPTEKLLLELVQFAVLGRFPRLRLKFFRLVLTDGLDDLRLGAMLFLPLLAAFLVSLSA